MKREFSEFVLRFKMRVNLGTLRGLLLNNVAEIRFVRKRPKPGSASTRRMICTNSGSLLNSLDGRVTLNYKPPKGRKHYDEQKSNVLITWDVFMQNYRTINAAQCDLITTIPENQFWDYFNQNLYVLSPAEKVGFMNS